MSGERGIPDPLFGVDGVGKNMIRAPKLALRIMHDELSD